MDYAKVLSERHGVILPPELLDDRRGLSKWIRDVLKSAPKGSQRVRTAAPLTPKQMAVIERNAPEDVKEKVRAGNVAAGRTFLEEFFSGRKKGRGYPGKWKGPRIKGKDRGVADRL